MSRNNAFNGSAVFLAQGYGKKGWSTLRECSNTAKSLGYQGTQLPLWVGDLIDVALAAGSKQYCDDLQANATADGGVPIVELANHCQTQLVRCSPTYFQLHSWVLPPDFRGGLEDATLWAQQKAIQSVEAAHNFGFKTVAAFSGTSIFHTVYPWPQRPAGLVNAAFNALAKAWMPVFDKAEELGVDVCFELHPGEDLMDGSTFERFLRHTQNHPRCKLLLDLSHFVLGGMSMRNLLEYVRRYSEYFSMMHVKDAEFLPSALGGAYGGYNDWINRPGRFRSLGDGQINYLAVLNLLDELQVENLWATLEWECCIKGWNQGVREGAEYINAWINRTAAPRKTDPEPHKDGAFDDFASGGCNTALIAQMLGIPESEVDTTAPA